MWATVREAKYIFPNRFSCGGEYASLRSGWILQSTAYAYGLYFMNAYLYFSRFRIDMRGKVKSVVCNGFCMVYTRAVL
ncbi:hypothetical protein Hjap01_04053 [Haloarcula japonica]